MKLFLILITAVLFTGCASSHKYTDHNPKRLNNDDLIMSLVKENKKLVQDIKDQKIDMQFEYLREIQRINMGNGSSSTNRPELISTQCKFFCF